MRNPPLLIVSDINHIVIRTNYTNLPTRIITLILDDLLDPESIKILKTVFFNPEQLKPQETIESVTREAAAQFSRLADNLRRYGSDPQEIAHFLIRLLGEIAGAESGEEQTVTCKIKVLMRSHSV